jgi:3-oxoacyl-[acyl-carrier protein] reductase
MPLALVTGASRGIGRAIAVDLARAGFDIVGTYRARRDEAEAMASEVQSLGRTAQVYALDVAEAEATEKGMAEILEKHGCPDALVCNAGITKDALFPMMSRESWDSVVRTNLGGFYSVVRPVARQMLRRRAGRIVTIASISGERGNAGQVNYSASKAGIIGATKALALELGARGITANVVSPGFIETEMTKDLPTEELKKHIPLGRLGTGADVAAAVTFLCSPQAGYITGQVISVNGGLYT